MPSWSDYHLPKVLTHCCHMYCHIFQHVDSSRNCIWMITERLKYLTSRNLPVMMIIVDGHVVGVPAVLEHRPFIGKSTYNIYCAVGICSYNIRYYSYVSGFMRLCCVAGHRVMIFQLRMLYMNIFVLCV